MLKSANAGSAQPGAAKRPLPAWSSLASLAALPLASGEPYATLGHGLGRYRALVRVSTAARDQYLAPTPERPFPEGSVVAQFLTDLDTGSAGPVYAMRKQSDETWQFAVLEPGGALLDFGLLPLCVRCHQEAPADFVFGLPRDQSE